MTTPGGQLTPGDETTPPVFGVPEGAYVGDAGAPNAITDLNDLNEAEAKRRMQASVAPAFNRQRDGVWQNGGLLSNLADLLFGIGEGSPAARLSDGMTDLNHRVDLMDDVSGYAGAFMSTNRRFGTGSAFKKIPFDTKYGPEKKAELDTANNVMVLETGSWSVHFTIVTAAASGIGGIGHSVRALIRDANGSEKIRRIFDWQAGLPEWAQHYAMPVIVTEDGWTVEIGYRHSGSWWPLSGGTEKTLLWVERKNIETDNNNIITDPPNGPDIT